MLANQINLRPGQLAERFRCSHWRKIASFLWILQMWLASVNHGSFSSSLIGSCRRRSNAAPLRAPSVRLRSDGPRKPLCLFHIFLLAIEATEAPKSVVRDNKCKEEKTLKWFPVSILSPSRHILYDLPLMSAMFTGQPDKMLWRGSVSGASSRALPKY